MPLTPPEDLARALGIQEDSNDLLPGSLPDAERIANFLATQSIQDVEVFWLSFSALYLPKFLSFFQQSPSYDPFNQAHFSFLGVLATGLLRPQLTMLFREQPEDGCSGFWWCLFVLASFPRETMESPQLLHSLQLTLVLLDNLTTVVLSQLDPTLFLPTDEDLASAIYTPLAATLPHWKAVLKADALTTSDPQLAEMEARLKEVSWLIEDDKEGAMWRRQTACVKAGLLFFWRCPNLAWMERDGGGEGGCRQIEKEEDWAICMKCETVRWCCPAHLELSAPEHERLCFRPEW